MSHQQQVVPPRTSANGFGHRRLDREGSGRHDNKAHLMKSASGTFSNSGLVNGGKPGHTSPSRDRLIYVMTQFIGHRVEVLVKNGSVISGIFHATNIDKDFGIVLKMAQLIKDGSIRGQRPGNDGTKKPQDMIIPARELVQVLAKDISLGSDEFTNGHAHDKRKDLMIDSIISHSHHVEERELERWTPDEDDPEFVELEKLNDRKWNRNWDQFEINETLFGVKSTFNEELYTTKLERGPHMLELEKQASRIAKEIEHEETKDIHLAEERGIYLDEDLDHDEEIKYSAVRRDIEKRVFQGIDRSSTNACNTRTSPDSFIRADNSEAQESSTSSVDKEPSADMNFSPVVSTDNASQLTYDCLSKKPVPVDQESRSDEKLTKDCDGEKNTIDVRAETALSEEGKPSISEDLKMPSSSSHAYDPSSSGQGHKCPDGLTSDSALSGKLSPALEPANSSLRPGSSTSSTSGCVAANSASGGRGISPSSSMGSLSSEKSSLNPNAKEFKLNPNAKSFTPSASVRPPQAPMSEGSFYYAGNMSTVPLGPGMPMGMAIPPAYGGQPVVYNPPPAQLQSPQGYIQPSGPPYGQQMMYGQPRPVYYYTPEMQQYRGRNF